MVRSNFNILKAGLFGDVWWEFHSKLFWKPGFSLILWWLNSVHVIIIRWNLGWNLLASWIGNWCHIKHYLIINPLCNFIWEAISFSSSCSRSCNISNKHKKRVLQRKTKKMMGSPRCGTQPEKGSCAAGRRQGRWNKIGYQWLPFQIHNTCMYQRFTLGGSDAGWAKHDLTYRVKGYPSDPNIQRQTVRKFCGFKKIIFQFSFFVF